jgi:hypothetical protein
VGSRVAIWGKHLSAATQVTINGVPAFVSKAGAGKVVVVVPVGASSGPVVVTTPAGRATSPRTFIVL